RVELVEAGVLAGPAEEGVAGLSWWYEVSSLWMEAVLRAAAIDYRGAPLADSDSELTREWGGCRGYRGRRGPTRPMAKPAALGAMGAMEEEAAMAGMEATVVPAGAGLEAQFTLQPPGSFGVV